MNRIKAFLSGHGADALAAFLTIGVVIAFIRMGIVWLNGGLA